MILSSNMFVPLICLVLHVTSEILFVVIKRSTISLRFKWLFPWVSPLPLPRKRDLGNKVDPLYNSHHLSTWHGIGIVRRNSVLVTHGSLRVNNQNYPLGRMVLFKKSLSFHVYLIQALNLFLGQEYNSHAKLNSTSQRTKWCPAIM